MRSSIAPPVDTVAVNLGRSLRAVTGSSPLFPSDEEATLTVQPYEMADDDLSRQRRKRDERLLSQPIPGAPELTVGDLVADVLAAADSRDGGAGSDLDVPSYLADRGHDWPTIKTVVEYVERHESVDSRLRPPGPLP
jgi:hypothetical protein